MNRPTELDDDGLSDENDGFDRKRNKDVDNRSKDGGDNWRNKNNNDNTDDYDEDGDANNRGRIGRQDHWDDPYGKDHEDKDETKRRRKVWREGRDSNEEDGGKGVRGAVGSEYRAAAGAYQSTSSLVYACLGTLIYQLLNAF